MITYELNDISTGSRKCLKVKAKRAPATTIIKADITMNPAIAFFHKR